MVIEPPSLHLHSSCLGWKLLLVQKGTQLEPNLGIPFMTDLVVHPNHMEFSYLQRGKVYRLNDEGKWDDKGTGHVSVEFLERSDAVGLVVIDEEDNQTLLVHRISADDIYRRQEDTIISWTDPEVATDLALSFQETMGCSFIWDQICSVQRSIHFPSVGGIDGSTRPVGDDLDHSGTSQDDDDVFRDGGASEVVELPPVELSTLSLLAKTVAEVIPFDRDRVACMIVRDQNYIPKLLQLFRTCEDLENLAGLRLIFKIVKGIISLNDGHIFDIIFSDEYIMDIVGALEYGSDVTKCHGHRTFLKEKAVFKEAVPIRDPLVLSKIHQTYRIGYIKDVILFRVLDDPTFASLNSIILFNNVSVVTALQSDSAFLPELFSRLRSLETSVGRKRDLVFFVQEFCNLSKHLQPLLRNQLFSALVKEGLLDIVKDTLKDTNEAVRLSGCDILIAVLNHDPALLRGFLVHQTSYILFNELVQGMLTPSESGVQAQLLEVVRMLLDSETIDTPAVEKSIFLETFYEIYMDQLVQLLTDGCPSEPGSLEPVNDPSVDAGKGMRGLVAPEILGNICELMCFCVQHHRFRIKHYVMRNQVVEKVLRLIRRKEKYLVVAAVRFLRTCISLKDEFYFRYIVKHNLFDPIIEAFVANGNRYNLLNSAILELIDFIRKEGLKILVVHLIEKYSSKLECIDYVDTYRELKLKYEQILEVPPPCARDAGVAVTSSSSDLGSRTGRDRLDQGGLLNSDQRKDDLVLDKVEDSSFSQDSDDEGNPAIAWISTSSQPQTTKSVTVNSSASSGVPSGESAGGSVHCNDENMPAALHTNRKKPGWVFEMKLDSILPAIPLTGSIWQEAEDGPTPKRKTPLAPSFEQTNATVSKRQKSEEGHQENQSKIHSGLSAVVDLSGAGSVEISSEVLGVAESMMLDSTPPAQGIITKACNTEEPNGTSVDQHESGVICQTSSSDHSSRSNTEATPDVDEECAHEDLDTSPLESASIPLGVNVDLVAGKSQLLNDTLADIGTTRTLVLVGNDPTCLEKNHSYDELQDVREKCVNVGENSAEAVDVGCSLVRESCSQDGMDSSSVEDINGSTSESSERIGLGAIPTKGVNDGNSSISQPQNTSLGSEGNRLTNLGTDIMRTVTPTSPGPYTVR